MVESMLQQILQEIQASREELQALRAEVADLRDRAPAQPIVGAAMYTPEQAAKLCQVSRPTIERAIRNKHLVSCNAGDIRIEGFALMAWLRSRKGTGETRMVRKPKAEASV